MSQHFGAKKLPTDFFLFVFMSYSAFFQVVTPSSERECYSEPEARLQLFLVQT